MKMTMIQISKTLKMQKYFIIVAVTMLSLVSCTKMEDMAPPRPITFNTAIYKPQTKAGEVSIMNEFTNFSCKAFLHAAGYESTTQAFFGDGETIYAYDGNNSKVTNSENSMDVAYWAPSHDYYWPKAASSYINFVAWYDKHGATPSTVDETHLVWSNYQVSHTDDNLLFADEAWRYNGNPSSIYHKENEGQSYKAVPMLFHHALAKICFKVVAEKTSQANVTGNYQNSNPGTTTWDVTLSNISLSGVYNTGTLTLTNADPANADPDASATTRAWTGGWEPSGDASPITMEYNNSLTTTAVDILEMRPVLPQSVTSAKKLSFDYNIDTYYQPQGGQSVRYSREKVHAEIDLSTILGASGAITSWDMNKKITYTININPETTLVRIDPAMVDWVTDSGSYPNNNN